MASDAPPLPRHLQVEVTGACNLRCRMCLVRYAPAVGRAEGALSYEQFLELVDALPALQRLTLQGLGEPLLSPHLLDMVRHAAARGVHVGFNTNGTLLSPARARALVQAGAAHVHVSLDGARAATYEDVRHGVAATPRPGQFARVVANLRGLVAARRDAGSATPYIALVFVAMRRNVEELPELVDLAADVGVDEIWVQNLSHVFSDTDAAGRYAAMRRYAADEALFADERAAGRALEVFAAARARAGELGVHLRLPRLEERETDRGPCSWPWEGAYVTHRGEVQPCCMVMGSDRATLGRLQDDAFDAIWHGEAYRRFRRGLLDGSPPEVCAGCSVYRGVF
ncbi:MAG TPA: radical SAM protein [Baekduia sp.]|nr:radical SAM protein [Baekduia sp.]